MSQPQRVVVNSTTGPGCLVRGLYFIFIGLWLGAIWVVAAWVLNVTIIGLPLGLVMLNRLPQIMTLQPERRETTVEVKNGVPTVTERTLSQPPFLLRALYFILIGWWFSLVWMILAWLISGITLGLGLPISFWMFDRVPALTTLARK